MRLLEQLHPYVHLPLVALVALASHWSSLDGDFAFDDHRSIVNNPVVRDGRWRELFSTDYWGTVLLSSNSHKSFRPITTATFM
jgi:hypothetical protein